VGEGNPLKQVSDTVIQVARASVGFTLHLRLHLHITLVSLLFSITSLQPVDVDRIEMGHTRDEESCEGVLEVA